MFLPLQGSDWGVHLTHFAHGSTEWKRLCNLSNSVVGPDMLSHHLGGATGCYTKTRAAVLLTYREMLKGLLRTHDIANKVPIFNST